MATLVAVKNAPSLWKKPGDSFSSKDLSWSLIDEQNFVRMLRVERKRTERSGKPFMLMLLHGGESFASGQVWPKVVGALASLIRETDSLGWYKSGSIVGILFTEIGEAEKAVIDTVLEKVTNSLREELDVEAADQIRLTYHVYPEKGDHHKKGSADIRLYPDLPTIEAHRKGALVTKRAIDILGSLFALVVLSPVFLLLALVIKLTSEGPVFFRQKRIGQHGKAFTFLKFRSMHANNSSQIHQEYVKKLIAGEDGLKQSNGNRGAFKLTNDPRITPVGRFIRRTSLDELPQFFNVLKGEMSLVGPRPPVPYEYEAYDIWHRHRMMEVKPGITGLWQVTGRSRTTFDEMVRLDLKYASSWSILMDLKILSQTPAAVLSGKGAY
jgi:exopolysaccharide biosynthesis polyprenyl glycosylphosphotransferase